MYLRRLPLRFIGNAVLLASVLLTAPLATAHMHFDNVHFEAAQPVAYVHATGGRTAGKLNVSDAPYASLQAALAAGATELRIEPGVYEEGLLDFAGGRAVILRSWNGRTGNGQLLDVAGTIVIRGTVRIANGTAVTLAESPAMYRLEGDLLLPEGTLDLRGHTLEIDGATVRVGAGSHLVDSAHDPASADCGGFISYIGPDDTDVFFESVQTRPRFDDVASQMVNKSGSGRVRFDMTGVPADNLAPNPPNQLDELGIPCFRITDSSPDQRAEFLDGLDLLDIAEDYIQLDGHALMSGLSSLTGTQPTTQEVRTGTHFMEEDGTFAATGGIVAVGGDFLLGRDAAATPSDALFDLGGGRHSIGESFRVAPDTDPCTGEIPEEGDACFGIATPQDDEQRNRYVLGGGEAHLWGDYFFHGTGDRFDDENFIPIEQGLDGGLFFVGDTPQHVHHRQDEDAFLNDVTLSGEGGLWLLEHATQNDDGVLTLELGIIDPGDDRFDWTVLNPAFEPDLVGRNNSARGLGTVDLGSRDSHNLGRIGRNVEFGTATGGIVTGGYLFPTGTPGEIRLEGGEEVDVNLFRPLILQFPDDLGRTSLARVDYRDDLRNEDCALPDEGLIVDAVGGEILTLNVLGNQFWQLEFDRIPAFDPNIRVEAEELPNILDIKSLRVVQWDCDCTNPRLAGLYDLDTGAVDDGSAIVNDFINDVPNLTQEGVDVNDCNLLGIASDIFINRIDLRFLDPDLIPVQIINATPESAADVYVDGQRLVNDLPAHDATPFGTLPTGAATVDVTAAAAPDNSAPLLNTTLTLGATPTLALLTGRGETFDLFVKDEARRTATSADKVDILVANAFSGTSDLAVTITDLQSQENPVDVGALGRGDFSAYQTIEPLTYVVTVTNPATGEVAGVFTIDLASRAEDVLTLVLTDTPPGKADGLTLLVFDASGQVLGTDDVTATGSDADLPETFALRGNYPNPFNPSTTLAFDLPEAAAVHAELYNVLGRMMMTTAVQQVDAGAHRTLEIDASALASGAYLYRVIARTETRTWVQAGRMMLVR